VTKQGLAHWLTKQVGAQATVGELVAPSAGMSNDTLLSVADWGDGPRDIVLRLAPEGRGLFPRYDLDAQVSVLRALRAHSDVPVPEVLWHEPDPEPLGRPFYVMARVDGRIPPDGHLFEGWVMDLPVAEQTGVLDAALDVVARINQVDGDTPGLEVLDRPEHGASPVDQELGYWRAYLDWATDGGSVPELDDLFDRLGEQRPARDTESRTLVWGDARLGNLVYDESLAVVGVLDWEMAVIGPPELDLGWYLFLERTALQFAEQLPGFSDRAGTIATYERSLGRPVRDLEWYEAWGGFRTACIQVRMVGMGQDHGKEAVMKALRRCTRR
jgi:aminoglycoside phosphotransferase (APT) family kinase protein